jgi:hypothetical protein
VLLAGTPHGRALITQTVEVETAPAEFACSRP